MIVLRDRPKFRATKFHKWMNLKCSLYNIIWRFYTHHCPKCGTLILSEKENVTVDNVEDNNVKYLGKNIELKRPLTLDLVKQLDLKDGGNSNQRAYRWANDGEHADFIKEYPDTGLTERFDTFEQIVDFAVAKWKELNIDCPFISLYKGDKYYKNKYNASETVILQYGA